MHRIGQYAERYRVHKDTPNSTRQHACTSHRPDWWAVLHPQTIIQQCLLEPGREGHTRHVGHVHNGALVDTCVEKKHAVI